MGNLEPVYPQTGSPVYSAWTMIKIVSKDSASYISIQRTGDERYSAYAIEVVLKLTGGEMFKGFNHDVQLLNLKTFVESLNKFIDNRERHVELNGTYDFQLKLRLVERDLMWVAVSLGYDRCLSHGTKNYRVCGGFEYDVEYLSGMLKGFDKLSG